MRCPTKPLRPPRPASARRPLRLVLSSLAVLRLRHAGPTAQLSGRYVRRTKGHRVVCECVPGTYSNTNTHPEHLAVLQRGSTAWNEWRQQNPHLIPVLARVDLAEQDLRGI